LEIPLLSTGIHRETSGSTPSVWYVTASLAAIAGHHYLDIND
jgi:hypothetical protein